MIRSFLKGGVFHKTPQLHENAQISENSDIVNKRYVDAQTTAAKQWSAITDKPDTFAPPKATQTVVGGAKMHIADGVLYIVTT